MLKIEKVTRDFGKKRALDNVSLEISPGSFVGIIGRSGAGKSTLLRCINRLVDPSTGKITFEDKDVTALSGASLRDWRRSCGMIFQQFNLAGRLDVMSNVLMGRLHAISFGRSMLMFWPKSEKMIALDALAKLDLADFSAQRAETLSGGQQQRVAIARTLVQNPKIVLADEPVASLDPRNTKAVMDTLRDLNKQLGITILCNLHSLDLARAYCGRLVGMKEGAVVFDGAPEQLTDAAVVDLYGLEANEVVETGEKARDFRKAETPPNLLVA